MQDRILIFIDWYRPGYKAGGPITSVANMVGQLKGQFHFHILTRNTDHNDHVPYPGIEANRWIEAEPGIKVCYLSNDKINKKAIQAKAKDANCNTWYIVGMYSWFFSIVPLFLAKRIGVPKVIISPRGMLSSHSLAQKSLKKKIFIFLSKMFRLYRDTIFQATSSEEEKSIIAILGRTKKIVLAPNLFRMPEAVESSPGKKVKDEITLLILSRISPEKNTLNALKIISDIPTGEISILLVGQISDRTYWEKCQEVIKKLPKHIQLEFKGALAPGMINELKKKIHFLFLPTTGENYGHSIIECMASGIPVIISDRTPWHNLQESGAGWDIPLSSHSRFRDVIVECVEMDQENYSMLSQSTRQFARQKYHDSSILESNLALFKFN